MFNELVNIFGLNIKIYCETQLPVHICNRADIRTLLNNCKVSIAGDSKMLDDSITEMIVGKLSFPNHTKSAANII